MSVFSAMNISATGMTAQRTRLDLISENIACSMLFFKAIDASSR